MIRPKAGLVYLKVPSGSTTTTISEEFCTIKRNQSSSFPGLPISRMGCSFDGPAASLWWEARGFCAPASRRVCRSRGSGHSNPCPVLVLERWERIRQNA
jgi:hypothetical protein